MLTRTKILRKHYYLLIRMSKHQNTDNNKFWKGCIAKGIAFVQSDVQF